MLCSFHALVLTGRLLRHNLKLLKVIILSRNIFGEVVLEENTNFRLSVLFKRICNIILIYPDLITAPHQLLYTPAKVAAMLLFHLEVCVWGKHGGWCSEKLLACVALHQTDIKLLWMGSYDVLSGPTPSLLLLRHLLLMSQGHVIHDSHERLRACKTLTFPWWRWVLSSAVSS